MFRKGIASIEALKFQNTMMQLHPSCIIVLLLKGKEIALKDCLIFELTFPFWVKHFGTTSFKPVARQRRGTIEL
jgi:hypothetical protein